VHQILGGLVIGAVAGGGARKVAWRPLAKVVIREGIRLSRNIQTATASVRSEAQRMVKEARAELDGTRPA
jgi:hypothetical protein